jgi:hypothetical protein
MSTICDFIKQQRTTCRSYYIEIADGYTFKQCETLWIIELYHNSKFTTGDEDGLGRGSASA